MNKWIHKIYKENSTIRTHDMNRMIITMYYQKLSLKRRTIQMQQEYCS